MITVNCFTNGFAEQLSTVPGKAPKYMQWTYYRRTFPGITIFENGHMYEFDPREIDTTYRVGWLTEAEALRPYLYSNIGKVADRFDRILTHNTQLVASDPQKFKLMPRMGIRIPRENWGGTKKTCGIAICVGQKNELEGHKLRHEIAARYTNLVDVFYDYDRVRDLSRYKFAIVCEAVREGAMFTEHLLDALALDCYVIYWGAPEIRNYIAPWFLTPFESIAQLDNVLTIATTRLRSWLPMTAGHAAISRFAEFEIPEDWMIQNLLQDYVRAV